MKKKWEKQIDPNKKYGGAFILGDRNVEIPPPAVVSVTRGEQFNSGKVQSYFLTWKANGYIPTYEESAEIVTTYGRHFDGGKLVRKAQQPNDFNKNPS
ncbi:hypothetical protein KW850_14830 [Bacillus sp. sid0103]|uniref:hypothetical protein n=1 Tax=Bacillus sp. sid0103 TaxID=2856337 RepID=UPI001C4558C0|nr:hypothetical protein [Bacillus sp. sid0103]MBV7506537.1 hypothetical protein [Bacillus sp. sid0103]